jgi:activator of 2-hydroxyglutaryl-CoA dehydratase
VILGDFGTSYTKLANDDNREIVPTCQLTPDLKADAGCGHNARGRARRIENELVALATGAQAIVGRNDFVCVDVGSRDIKKVTFRSGQYAGCDWNYMCGAMTGFTMELLSQHYELLFEEITPSEEGLPVKCGILGISNLFDLVAQGEDLRRAVAKFVKGVATNVYAFAGKPQTLFLAGGMCDNSLFVRSLPAEVVRLGRFVSTEGLKTLLEKGIDLPKP